MNYSDGGTIVSDFELKKYKLSDIFENGLLALEQDEREYIAGAAMGIDKLDNIDGFFVFCNSEDFDALETVIEYDEVEYVLTSSADRNLYLLSPISYLEYCILYGEEILEIHGRSR